MAYPVYGPIAAALKDDPSLAFQIDPEQLRTLLDLSERSPGNILDRRTHLVVKEAYQRSMKGGSGKEEKVVLAVKKKPVLKKAVQAPPVAAPPAVAPVAPLLPAAAPAPLVVPVAPKAKVKPSLVSKPKPKPVLKQAPDVPLVHVPPAAAAAPAEPHKATILRLNADHKSADSMEQAELKALLEWSDTVYYSGEGIESVTLLRDDVYDYVKRTYNQRSLKTSDKKITMKSISSKSGVGVKPVRGRDTTLPVALRSLDNINYGEGDVQVWAGKKTGPYLVSAKMDGMSSLYHEGKLYSRGDATTGRNITHLLQYLNLPDFPHAVRGELVVRKDVFDAKYLGKPGPTGEERKANRNSVAGAVGAINHRDEEFLGDLEFVAYEVIVLELSKGGQPQPSPSEQYEMLEAAGFQTAAHTIMGKINDEALSQYYTELRETYPYEMDGLVAIVDKPYVRSQDRNPDYAKAFKEGLACELAVTKVIKIEWNISQYGYFIPTIVYEPRMVCGVKLSRATGHNARDIVNLGLGPGAEVEVEYRDKVNPQIKRVLTAVAPDLPKVTYKWVPSPSGEPKHIMFDAENQQDEDSHAEANRSIDVKKIHKFLVTIGAKGIGETTVEKIYDEAEKHTVGDFINMTVDEILFLGGTISKNIIKSISEAMLRTTVPVLMASSKVFGRGLGVRKFTKVFRTNPSFMEKRLAKSEYIREFKKIEGFAEKTATLAADGMVAYWQFVDNEMPQDVYQMIVDNTIRVFSEKDDDSASTERNAEIDGKNICITGFRDQVIQDFIEANGGNVQNDVRGNTNMVLRATDGYTNNKTTKAESQGIPLLSKAEFKSKFGL